MNQHARTTPGRRPHRLDGKFACALVLIAISISSVGCADSQWWLDAGYAERLAVQENKPILFYFKAWDSTQHRNMKKQVLDAPQVKRELKDLVTVELEFAWSAPYDKRFKVHRSQMCVMCKPSGEMVGSSLYVNPVPAPEKFIEWLKQTKQQAMPPKPTTQKAPVKKLPPIPPKEEKSPPQQEGQSPRAIEEAG